MSLQQPQQQQRPKILLWGDSLTQLGFEGWSSILANTYQRRADVINRGLSGYNTSWYLQYVQTSPADALLLQLQPINDTDDDEKNATATATAANNVDAYVTNVVLIIIWFGANDASLPDLNPRQYVSLDQYQRNLHSLIALARHYHPNAKLLLVTPPPVVHEQRLVYQIQRYGKDRATGLLERTLENSGRYAHAAECVANECSIPCLNLWTIMQQQQQQQENHDDGDIDSSSNVVATTSSTTISSSSKEATATASTPLPFWSRYFSDGLHFSKLGQEFVGQTMVSFIHKSFPTLAVLADPLTGQWANSSSQSGDDLFYNNHGLPPFHEDIDHNNVSAAFSHTNNNNQKDSLPTKKAKTNSD